MGKAKLVPFFEKKLGEKFGHGRARKTNRHGNLRTRYFTMLVIATDNVGVTFEAWSSEAINTCNDTYHGVTYVDLANVESIVQAQMIAAENLPASKDETSYTTR